MHKLVATTFKILICSMLFMLILDTTLIMIEVISVHSKVTNITAIVQTEVAKNNYLPKNLGDSFNEYFNDIETASSLMTDGDITTNFDKLSKMESVKEYGEMQEIQVKVRMHPLYVYYRKPDSANASVLEREKKNNDKGIEIDYSYKVPCLRYLK